MRERHSKKEIEDALREAEQLGWRVERLRGRQHRWGRLLCPQPSREGCRPKSIWSTPRNPGRFAQEIRAAVDSCPHWQR
ncbi:MAG: hypothetical protein OXG27_03145 [Chloroflexi bacterium]|nr:hypothetical protein [Chloroflexota bacterium]